MNQTVLRFQEQFQFASITKRPNVGDVGPTCFAGPLYRKRLRPAESFNTSVKLDSSMTEEEKAQLIAICERIAVGKGPHTFHALIVELNDLLERKEHRLQSKSGQTVI